jgi:hypothetical protein
MDEQVIRAFFERTTTPGFCCLCDEPPDAISGPLVDTVWGPMHEACRDSEPPADYGEGATR